jgi:hypothetical protein
MPRVEIYTTEPARPRTPTIALPECDGCRGALLSALADARGREFPGCAGCETFYSFAPPAPLPRPPRAPRPEGAPAPQRPGPEATLVPRFVAQLLSWNASVELVERAAKGVASSTLTAIESARIGIVGSGCTGSKGAGRRASPEVREVRSADPVGTARYQQLAREHRATADAVISDGQGYQEVEMAFKRRSYRLTLEHRVGFRLAAARVVEDWTTHLVNGDSRPALVGMLELGDAALKGVARAWEAATF